MAKCIIENCNKELLPHARLPLCSLCRSSIGRWQKRRPAEVLERRRKLHLYDARMEEVVVPKLKRSKK